MTEKMQVNNLLTARTRMYRGGLFAFAADAAISPP